MLLEYFEKCAIQNLVRYLEVLVMLSRDFFFLYLYYDDRDTVSSVSGRAKNLLPVQQCDI